jgi:hypothetical protein
MTRLVDQVLGLHHALVDSGLDHAFGGALALAYCTNEPRATRDIDLNVFVQPTSARRAVAALPAGVDRTEADITVLGHDGQIRLQWDDTPVDVFLSTHEFHRIAATRVRHEPFAGEILPFLSGTDLVVFKAMFNRPKDWVDIAEVAAVNGADFGDVRQWLVDLLGQDDERVERLDAVLAEGSRPQANLNPVFLDIVRRAERD